ncbi:hypothetical protein FQN54_005306 [Arachnomyces sp. PD_36]|nr:hypothetical protein FQN54_005306 [Arachnomyces sp. PD_36]
MDVDMSDAPPSPGVDTTASKPGLEIAFILGGPGAGKGTQCARLANDLRLGHVSAGDLLRQEKDHQSPDVKRAIENAAVEGKLVPPSIIMPILRKELERQVGMGRSKVLLDGFPRDFAQARAFEEEFGLCSLVLYFKCSKEIMHDRVRGRAGTSGRSDDNDETFEKRLVGFWADTLPLAPYLEDKLKDRFIVVDAEIPLKEGYQPLKQLLIKRGFDSTATHEYLYG